MTLTLLAFSYVSARRTDLIPTTTNTTTISARSNFRSKVGFHPHLAAGQALLVGEPMDVFKG